MKTRSLLKKQIGVVFAIDMDGTLCFNKKHKKVFTPQDVKEQVPSRKMIEKVNEVALKNYIIIYTARSDHLIPATLVWLRKNGVKFHAISNNKIPAIYVDDRAISFSDFFSLKT